MMLILSALGENNQIKQFTCSLESVEDGFDFLSRIVAGGDTLLAAHLLENRKQVELPVTAFDGMPMSVAIRQLEHEWQAVLNAPAQTLASIGKETVRLIQSQIRQYQITIAQHQQMINHYQTWLRRTESSFGDVSRRNVLIRRYQVLIERHQIQLGKAQAGAQAVTNRLSALRVV